MRTIAGLDDWNRDGRADVLAIRSDGTLWCYLGTANGRLGPATQAGRGWGAFTSVVVPGDLSGDGRSDLVGLRNDGKLFAYTNRQGSWSTPRQIGSGFTGYRLIG